MKNKKVISIIVSVGLIVGLINADMPAIQLPTQQDRLQQLKNRTKKELHEFILCVKRDKNCNKKRSQIYQVIGALLLALGAGTAYYFWQSKKPIINNPDAKKPDADNAPVENKLETGVKDEDKVSDQRKEAQSKNEPVAQPQDKPKAKFKDINLPEVLKQQFLTTLKNVDECIALLRDDNSLQQYFRALNSVRTQAIQLCQELDKYDDKAKIEVTKRAIKLMEDGLQQLNNKAVSYESVDDDIKINNQKNYLFAQMQKDKVNITGSTPDQLSHKIKFHQMRQKHEKFDKFKENRKLVKTYSNAVDALQLRITSGHPDSAMYQKRLQDAKVYYEKDEVEAAIKILKGQS